MSATTTDVGALLDEGRWSGYQKRLVGATALTIIFGFTGYGTMALLRSIDVSPPTMSVGA